MIKKRIMINKKSYAVRMTAIAVAMMLGLTGCGKKEEKAPELLEPVTTNEAYRPVDSIPFRDKTRRLHPINTDV